MVSANFGVFLIWYTRTGGIISGLAFLIPFIITLVLVKMPLTILERSMGQFFRKPLPEIYAIYGKQYIGNSFIIVIIYLIIGYFHLYLTIYCIIYVIDALIGNTEWLYSAEGGFLTSLKLHFENETLQLDRMSGPLGGLNTKVTPIYLIIWVFIYFSMWKGIRSTDTIKLTLIFSIYLALAVMLINIIFMPGSFAGIKYLMTPRFDKLFSTQTWKEALDQNYFQSILDHTGSMATALFKMKSSKVFTSVMM